MNAYTLYDIEIFLLLSSTYMSHPNQRRAAHYIVQVLVLVLVPPFIGPFWYSYCMRVTSERMSAYITMIRYDLVLSNGDNDNDSDIAVLGAHSSFSVL